ncbi:hypothetical protein EJB05_05982 [Eragrostis curvula]|uniref:Endonuclease/exonuclease/phosphatase domain-containing protein n=1 Tax=Eragrostis curvula TaxID=38414 RepID=A0A5J9WEI0_9POAL|nr:hypothetical protein EJB05_05982 [Eragrostis curvula]
MATRMLFSSAASPLLLLRPGRLNPISAFLHLPVPRKRSVSFPFPAMSSAPRFLVLDDDNDPLDFGAVAGAAFLPLQRCSRRRQRAASPEVVEVRQESPEVFEVQSDGVGRAGEEVKAHAAKKGKPNTHLDNKAVKVVAVPSEVFEVQPDAIAKKGKSNTHLDKKAVKIMTYNVWFREEVELNIRMNALGNLIKRHNPDLICFQEVTPNIYLLFEKSDWWGRYKCSLSHKEAMIHPYYCMQMSKVPVKSFDCIPFSYSQMGRELCIAHVNIGGVIELVLATSHLESPCPAPPKWDQMYSKERVAQANESLRLLEAFRNVIFCGDMNWDDKGDGPFPLPDGWIDAWVELKPGEIGLTYDTKANLMLKGNRKVQKRLDRFVCKLSDFKVDSIEMIGKEEIPGITYIKEKKVRNEIRRLELPVFPSDHFGLVLTITY